jgi:hypothetical protein
MVSGRVMVETVKNAKEVKMASTKKGSSKSAGKQKIQAGPSGKMQKFTPVKDQKPGVTSVTNTGGGYAKK